MRFTIPLIPLARKCAITLLSFFILCYCIAPTLAFAQQQKESESKSNIPALRVENLQVSMENFAQNREKSVQNFLSDRQKTYYVLSGLLNSTDNQVQCSAAFLLGRGRYQEAVGPLWQIITLKDNTKSTSFRVDAYKEYWQEYPAAEALVAIGKPSIRLMLLNLESSDDELVRELSLKVIRDIEGADIAQFIVQRAIDKQEIAVEKERLKAALIALSMLKSGLKPELDIFRR